MTDVWGANTFPVRKYNSRTFHLKVRRSRLFWFFQCFPQIKVGGDSAHIPFVEHASRESRVALPPKGRLRHLCHDGTDQLIHLQGEIDIVVAGQNVAK